MRTHARASTGPGLLVALLVAGLAGSAQAEMEVRWRFGAASHKLGPLRRGGEIVADPLAPGGKALRLPHAKGRLALPSLGARDLTLAGPVTFVAHVRAEGIKGLSQTFRLAATLRDQETWRRYQAGAFVQPVRVPADKYVALPFRVRFPVLPGEPRAYTLAVEATWAAKPEGKSPVVWLARLELHAHGEAAPYIGKVESEKNCYRPRERVRIQAVVVNPTERAFEGSLLLEERYGLETSKEVADRRVRVEPGKAARLQLTWRARGPECGREAWAALRDAAGKALDTAHCYYGVAQDPSFLVTTGQFAGGAFYPVGHTGLAHSVRTLEGMKARGFVRCEFFSWSYNELAQFLPPKDEEPYLGTEGGRWVSLKKMKRHVRMLKEAGITPITYIAGCLWGPAAYELYQRHPDWLVYSRNGELGLYNMESRAKHERRHDFEFVPYGRRFFWGTLNATLPETRRYIADQIIHTAKVMGFEGARWDVWNMDVPAHGYTLEGKEIASSVEEADRLTAESLRVLKKMVARELPHFTWGYNKVSPERNKKTPLTQAEKCRGGGWLLDEVVCTYHRKTSPYHYWHAYRDRIVGWADHCRKLGGIYNPYPFRRGGGKYPVDKLYESIFSQAAGGRYGAYGPYENDDGLVGRLGSMVFRFSNTFYSWHYDLQPKDQTRITVHAPDTLWWRQMVFLNRSLAGRRQAIVHLVNSPVAAEAEENPHSLVRPPVADVKVTCRGERGRMPRKAWAVAAEPMWLGEERAVQAVPLELAKEDDGVSVVVPAVLYWKTVVFEY